MPPLLATVGLYAVAEGASDLWSGRRAVFDLNTADCVWRPSGNLGSYAVDGGESALYSGRREDREMKQDWAPPFTGCVAFG
eukprot:CAMPEP_0174331248 /NCGR_PEP_ID=MMETSP0810-20121108/17346_1 /TAXON_ID=73025 ORGANISM="Eutreptiella gymnastica-like, Strain CCMP1594" /NCGR_SAMPLE_ID=MMETSP0810 /ASSEMBLY_ACC=CAM_ASM_000659 /LENGTH=80 /DNA_ID=CAMNT_0015446943 /DNA_START=741 /DNA_END=983 /DNA_ORIENTATION=+